MTVLQRTSLPRIALINESGAFPVRLCLCSGLVGLKYTTRVIQDLVDSRLRSGDRPRGSEKLTVADAVDFWRVEAYEPDRRLRLVAEMLLPGRAWLEFQVEETEDGAVIRQTAVFDPVGVAGLAYWYGIYPVHRRVFAGMLRRIASQGGRVAAPQAVALQEAG
ncbi:MAG: DUF2867 domain-containing protein [bacterium]|nr:DUF2867 domain-containing protein [bacterium]